jgi:arylsulfatase A-like enzyme
VFDVLKRLGYRTGLVSSQNEHWGNMHNFFDTGGLDHFFHSESLPSSAIPDADPGFAEWAKRWGRSGKLDDRDTIDEAIRFVGEAPADKPFFLYVNLQNSHFPYHTPEGFPRRYQPDTIDFPYAFGNYPREKVEIVKNRWRNSLSYVDVQIGRLLDHLKRTGVFERTLLVIGADNGEAFYEHETVCHAPASSPAPIQDCRRHSTSPRRSWGSWASPFIRAFRGSISCAGPGPRHGPCMSSLRRRRQTRSRSCATAGSSSTTTGTTRTSCST